VFLLIWYVGLSEKGVVLFFSEWFTAPFEAHGVVAKIVLAFPNFLLRVIEEAVRPISLSLRLFGNMYAGEMIFILLASFTLGLAAPGTGVSAGDWGWLLAAAAAMAFTVFLVVRGRGWFAFAVMLGIPLLGAFGLLPLAASGGYAQILLATAWTLFHVLIISLQAYIFMTLTVVYMAMAADHH
jgi:F-type H+-transporting ATPase subunit a